MPENARVKITLSRFRILDHRVNLFWSVFKFAGRECVSPRVLRHMYRHVIFLRGELSPCHRNALSLKCEEMRELEQPRVANSDKVAWI